MRLLFCLHTRCLCDVAKNQQKNHETVEFQEFFSLNMVNEYFWYVKKRYKKKKCVLLQFLSQNIIKYWYAALEFQIWYSFRCVLNGFSSSTSLRLFKNVSLLNVYMFNENLKCSFWMSVTRMYRKSQIIDIWKLRNRKTS